MRVLLTGFDPFEGNTINPALEVVKGVREKIGEIEIKKLEIPTVFGKVWRGYSKRQKSLGLM